MASERKIEGTQYWRPPIFESSDRTVSSRSTAFERARKQVVTELDNQMKLQRFISQGKEITYVIL